MSDRLFIDIDLTALDAALDRLSASMGVGTGGGVLDPHVVSGLAPGQTMLDGQLIGGYGDFIRVEMDKEYNRRIFPAINRDVRVILTQLGLGPAVRASFYGRRVERGFALGGPQMYAALAASLILLWRMFANRGKEIEAMNKRYEMAIRGLTGVSEKEYLKWIEEFGGKPFTMGVRW